MIYVHPHSAFQSICGLLRPLALIVILFWLFGDRAQAAAPQAESLSAIRAAALTHARAHLPAKAKVEAGRMDERLRLPACPAPLSTRTSSESASALSVEVRCDAAGWKLYVPVSVTVQVPVLVARRGMGRGETVTAADVETQMRERAGLGPAWLGSVEELKGRVLNRPVAAGSVLAPFSFAPARLVRRGQPVTLIGVSGGFEVRAQGKALADAGAGDRVRVQNLSSRRVVEGEVQADGSVVVPL